MNISIDGAASLELSRQLGCALISLFAAVYAGETLVPWTVLL